VRIRFDPLVVETANRIASVRDFVRALDAGLPEAEKHEIATLTARANNQGWGEDDLLSALDSLRVTFQHWLPRFAGYASIALIHSVVETQLNALCRRLQHDHHYSLGLGDIAGHSVDRAKKYLTKVAGLKIATDLAWGEIQNLKDLREIVAHGRGEYNPRGPDPDAVRRLMSHYPGDVSWFQASFEAETEIQVSSKLCAHFIDVVEVFFKRIYKAANLPDKGIWTET